MTRSEHLAWAKARALEILDDPAQPDGDAVTSFVSDLRKHGELEEHPALNLLLMSAIGGLLRTPKEVRNMIEGFN